MVLLHDALGEGEPDPPPRFLRGETGLKDQTECLFFGQLRDLAGRGGDSLTLPEGSTLADLLAHYERGIPRLRDFLPSLALSLNQEYASPEAVLRDHDEVALLPPVSGGTPEPVVRLVRERIDPHQVVPPLERPEDGAIVIFDGIVRNH